MLPLKFKTEHCAKCKFCAIRDRRKLIYTTKDPISLYLKLFTAFALISLTTTYITLLLKFLCVIYLSLLLVFILVLYNFIYKKFFHHIFYIYYIKKFQKSPNPLFSAFLPFL